MILFFIMFTQNTKQIKATVQWMKIIKVEAGEVLFNRVDRPAQNYAGRASHTTVHAGLAYSGSLNCGATL